MEQVPVPRYSCPPLLRTLPAGAYRSPCRLPMARPKPRWSAPWKRRSHRVGYNDPRQDTNEQGHLTARFSLDGGEDEDEARVLRGEMVAWCCSVDDETHRL